MKLTVLGNQGPFPGAGGACSGYLLESDNAKILIDCGSGVLANLEKVCKIGELDAIILSHLHSDHIGDMMVLKYAVTVSQIRPYEESIRKIPVYCPASPQREFENIDREAFEINIINEKAKLNIKDIDISFLLTAHSYECYAVCISSNGKKIVYTGDSQFADNLVDFSKNADLLIGDSNFTQRHNEKAKGAGVKLPHMTARENAEIAKKANVKRLILSHFWPYDDTRVHLKEAMEVFDNTGVSRIMDTYEN